eukprot:GHVT01023461.1.p1 GENE.GHVT01023461.1~~GHVT01023461.1.p1  ORF type:complete len:321 (+),score=23.20 GHVT01023461.1:1562-2524(+)
MMNATAWPTFYLWWLRKWEMRFWKIIRQERISLQLPEVMRGQNLGFEAEFETNEENLLRKESPMADEPEDIDPVDSCRTKIKRSAGVLYEVQGEPFFYFLWRIMRNFVVPKKWGKGATPHNAFYVGQVNDEGIPDGFGLWRRDQYHAEAYIGYWNNGFPIGPFKCREFGTGSGFMCIRLAWCKVTLSGNTCSAIEMGLSDAECCVSGQFFRTFPRVINYHLRKNSRFVSRMIHKLREMSRPEATIAQDFGKRLSLPTEQLEIPEIQVKPGKDIFDGIKNVILKRESVVAQDYDKELDLVIRNVIPHVIDYYQACTTCRQS